MRGLLNILFAVLMCACVTACKTRMHVRGDMKESTFGSFGSVSAVNASSAINSWMAKDIIANANSGSWKKIRIFDPSLPGNPIVMEMEQHDSINTNSIMHSNDSSMIIIKEDLNDIVSYSNGSDIIVEKEKDIESEERISDIMSNFIKIWIMSLVIAGLYVIYKKIR